MLKKNSTNSLISLLLQIFSDKKVINFIRNLFKTNILILNFLEGQGFVDQCRPSKCKKASWTKRVILDLYAWVICKFRKVNQYTTQALTKHGYSKVYTARYVRNVSNLQSTDQKHISFKDNEPHYDQKHEKILSNLLNKIMEMRQKNEPSKPKREVSKRQHQKFPSARTTRSTRLVP